MEVFRGRRGREIFIHVIVLVCVAFFLEVILIGGVSVSVRRVVVMASAVVTVVLFRGTRAAGGTTRVVRALITRRLKAN